MRVAVPSGDGFTIAQHFGRSASFLVFDIESGEIRGPETRPNRMHESDRGECGSGEHHGAGHNHDGIVAALADCQIVLCGGMGRRAAEALASAGISVVTVAPTGGAAETVAAWLSGAIEALPGGFCRCH